MIIFDSNSQISFSEWLEISRKEGSAVLIDKEVNWTSFDVVAKLRRIANIKKIGHCGTLDPFATGLLILCLGKATKQIYTFQDAQKQYETTIKLGATTKSYDTEQEEENAMDTGHLDDIMIADAVNSFVGKIQQLPPMFSAKKIGKRKLYDFARKGKTVEISPVEVNIQSIKIVNIDMPYIKVVVDCSKGTYIRALARDIGEKLGVGGYLTQLRRTRIGNYNVNNALPIKYFIAESEK